MFSFKLRKRYLNSKSLRHLKCVGDASIVLIWAGKAYHFSEIALTSNLP